MITSLLLYKHFEVIMKILFFLITLVLTNPLAYSSSLIDTFIGTTIELSADDSKELSKLLETSPGKIHNVKTSDNLLSLECITFQDVFTRCVVKLIENHLGEQTTSVMKLDDSLRGSIYSPHQLADGELASLFFDALPDYANTNTFPHYQYAKSSDGTIIRKAYNTTDGKFYFSCDREIRNNSIYLDSCDFVIKFK